MATLQQVGVSEVSPCGPVSVCAAVRLLYLCSLKSLPMWHRCTYEQPMLHAESWALLAHYPDMPRYKSLPSVAPFATAVWFGAGPM